MGAVAEQAYYSTKRSYIRIGRVVVSGAVILLIARIWGIDFTEIGSSDFAATFAANVIEFLIILAVGYLVWEIVTLLINRQLAEEQTAAGIDPGAEEPGGGEGGGEGGSRLSTVLPILKMTVQAAIIVLTVLVALSNVGIDITPLLAGAGIVGLAIGFGAQTLVRDVVSGVFFLIDDAFRVGEYVVIGDTMGTVEKISLRSLQLRHHKGPVHTVPYGEIPKITNNSRDWVIMKLKFTFPFDTDVNRIKKIFKKIGQEMLETDYADDLFQTFKSQGVLDVDDVGIVVRSKFMTKPGTQWVIRKDIHTRIQKALDEAGIQFAGKEVRVQLDGPDGRAEISENAQKIIAGAAAALDFIEALVSEVGTFDPPLQAVPKLNGSLRRVHGDTRFSKDKRPYHGHMHLIFRTGDHPNRSPGLHLVPGEDGLGMGAGHWGFGPDELKRYRGYFADLSVFSTRRSQRFTRASLTPRSDRPTWLRE